MQKVQSYSYSNTSLTTLEPYPQRDRAQDDKTFQAAQPLGSALVEQWIDHHVAHKSHDHTHDWGRHHASQLHQGGHSQASGSSSHTQTHEDGQEPGDDTAPVPVSQLLLDELKLIAVLVQEEEVGDNHTGHSGDSSGEDGEEGQVVINQTNGGEGNADNAHDEGQQPSLYLILVPASTLATPSTEE